MRLLLVRHGETDWNRARRFQGQTDTALNQTGWDQAAAVAHQLASEPIGRIISSPLKRAWQTAEKIAHPHQLPVEIEPALIELYLGSWQGRTYDEVAAEYPQVHATKTAPHGGETIQDVADRLRPWLAQLTAETEKQSPILIVAHGVIVQVCLCLIHKVDIREYQQFTVDNVSITEAFLP